jgi:hypothetical protein
MPAHDYETLLAKGNIISQHAAKHLPEAPGEWRIWQRVL